jgi:hypothetical protein
MGGVMIPKLGRVVCDMESFVLSNQTACASGALPPAKRNSLPEVYGTPFRLSKREAGLT